MPKEFDFHFQIPFSAVGKVDAENCVIHGVSIMQGNLTAEGHDLEVDATTLSQVLALAQKKGKIPVKLNHGSGIENLNGYIDGKTAWMDLSAPAEPKIRGDWHLLKTHGETPMMLERAEKQPETFGMSAAFKGKGEKMVTGKNAARASALKSVDCVTDPAANTGGLFSAKVDTGKNGMPQDTDPNAVTEVVPVWAQTLLTKVDALTTRQEAFEKEVAAQLEQNNEPGLDELGNMTDEQLEAAGFDIAKVRAAVEDAIASGELTAEGAAPEGTEGAPAAAAAAATPAGTAMSAKAIKDLIQFEIGKVRRQAREAAEQAEAEQAFAVIEEKTTALAAKNDELTIALATKEAEVKSLRTAVKTGVRPVAPAVEIGVDFSAKEAAEGTYEAVVLAEFNRLIKAGKKEVDAKADAYSFAARKHPDLYQEFRDRGSKPIELVVK